jgi:transposase
VARYEEVLALARQGLGPKAIGQRVGLTRQTVARWLRAGGFPERPRTPRGSPLLGPSEPYLRERWQAGCQNARQLWREVREQGFGGGAETVRRCVLAWRTEPARPGPPRRRARPQPQAPPPPPATRPRSPRQARWLLVKPTDELDADERTYLEQLVHECPDVLAAQRLTREFNRLVRERDEAALTSWLEAATGSELPEFRDFAAGIRRDLAAVEAALRYAWSNGQTEAQVLQLKTVRRQMRGRGRFELVRRRVVKGPTSARARRKTRRRGGLAA